MEEKAPKIFGEGFNYEPKELEKAPWIKGQLSIKVVQAIEFLQKHQNDRGYVNLDLKEGKTGKLYFELNQWNKPVPKPDFVEELAAIEQPKEEINPDDIPF